jgi:dCMP deaminase
MRLPDWDDYFMSMTFMAAMRSKDTSSKVGAVIVGANREIRSTGYNSFVRGINDHVPERYERPEKYCWFEHAERNAIYNAARVGIPLDGCTIYVLGFPCADCARAIIQSGIRTVIYLLAGFNQKWQEHRVRSEKMFEEADVRVIEFKGQIIRKIESLIDGKDFFET